SAGMTQVALDEATVSPPHLGQDFAGGEMDHFIQFHARIRFAPAGNGNVQHLEVSNNNNSLAGHAGDKRARNDKSDNLLIHPNYRRRRESAVWPHAADAIPAILGARLFALAFVAFLEAGDE